ncbi:hypothetical protein [Bradyrhizobium sp. sBnM-33]|uniref:hypothetical protein n=1 Tax=Bradyrhizobium sp. sBnM-33 TaxID=2831780 RepID=UPI0020C100CD|nr:hypothetical protein [Bradyrhizobium sp. sBnM-33]WOH54858.1 hypothetical protein RX328_10960 [Bradyrhizobium sp. sBnM-33]
MDGENFSTCIRAALEDRSEDTFLGLKGLIETGACIQADLANIARFGNRWEMPRSIRTAGDGNEGGRGEAIYHCGEAPKGADLKSPTKLETVKSTESVVLSEWLSSPAIMAWAAVPTKLGAEDLRPYLFVAKDRKDYVGSASVLGHLTAAVEQLFGGKFAVQGLDADLRRLAPPEPINPNRLTAQKEKNCCSHP